MKSVEIKKALEWVKANREKAQILGALFMTSLVVLWIFQKPSETHGSDREATELGVTIPKGFLVVPLELGNARQLSSLISHTGIIDVFLGEGHCIAKNLRVIKLNQEDQIVFGALVPDDKASELQGIFSDHKLKGALRSATAEPTHFYAIHKKENTTSIYQTEDNL